MDHPPARVVGPEGDCHRVPGSNADGVLEQLAGQGRAVAQEHTEEVAVEVHPVVMRALVLEGDLDQVAACHVQHRRGREGPAVDAIADAIHARHPGHRTHRLGSGAGRRLREGHGEGPGGLRPVRPLLVGGQRRAGGQGEEVEQVVMGRLRDGRSHGTGGADRLRSVAVGREGADEPQREGLRRRGEQQVHALRRSQRDGVGDLRPAGQLVAVKGGDGHRDRALHVMDQVAGVYQAQPHRLAGCCDDRRHRRAGAPVDGRRHVAAHGEVRLKRLFGRLEAQRPLVIDDRPVDADRRGLSGQHQECAI